MTQSQDEFFFLFLIHNIELGCHDRVLEFGNLKLFPVELSRAMVLNLF